MGMFFAQSVGITWRLFKTSKAFDIKTIGVEGLQIVWSFALHVVFTSEELDNSKQRKNALVEFAH